MSRLFGSIEKAEPREQLIFQERKCKVRYGMEVPEVQPLLGEDEASARWSQPMGPRYEMMSQEIWMESWLHLACRNDSRWLEPSLRTGRTQRTDPAELP